MSPEGQDAGREQDAEAQEGDRGRVEAEGRRGGPQADHPREGGGHDLLVRAERAQLRERPPRGPGRLRRRGHLGRDDLVEDERQEGHRGEGRDRGRDEPGAEADLEAVAAGDLRAERVRGHGREPEGRRDGQARDAREHQEAAEALAALLSRLRARRLGHRQHERVEDAGAGGVAGEGGGDHAVDEEDAVAEAERRSAEGAHHEVAEALAQAALHDRAGHEEGDDDQEDRPVGEARVGLRRGERPGEDGRGEGEHGGGQDGKGADHDRRDRCDEEGEQVPGGGHESLGHRREPDPEGEDDDGAPGQEHVSAGGGRGHGVVPFRRTRPRRPTARPWITPSSADRTYCQVNEYSPSRPA